MLLKSLFVLTQLHCYTVGYASVLRSSRKIYITTPQPINEMEPVIPDVKTDLTAPEALSLPQYHQYPKENSFTPSESPFLYSFIIVGSPKQEIGKNETESTSNSYELYRPTLDESFQFVDMLPPPESPFGIPNYYEMNKRKNKKYFSSDEKQKKYHKMKEMKSNGSIDRQDVSIETNDELPEPSNYEKTEIYVETKPYLKQIEINSKSHEEQPPKSEGDDLKDRPTSRIDFQIHGHKGPKTYKFGYDTGRGKNRHFKLEEKDEHGNVIGQYGYHDDKGKLRVVKYSSMKNDGFKVL